MGNNRYTEDKKNSNKIGVISILLEFEYRPVPFYVDINWLHSFDT